MEEGGQKSGQARSLVARGHLLGSCFCFCFLWCCLSPSKCQFFLECRLSLTKKQDKKQNKPNHDFATLTFCFDAQREGILCRIRRRKYQSPLAQTHLRRLELWIAVMWFCLLISEWMKSTYMCTLAHVCKTDDHAASHLQPVPIQMVKLEFGSFHTHVMQSLQRWIEGRREGGGGGVAVQPLTTSELKSVLFEQTRAQIGYLWPLVQFTGTWRKFYICEI